MEDVKQLSLIGVETLDLGIEDGVWINFNTADLLDEF